MNELAREARNAYARVLCAKNKGNEAAREARNAYARKWRAENKDKVRAAEERYWMRRAEREGLGKKSQREECEKLNPYPISFHLDKRVHALGHTARLLYECMRQEAEGEREVLFTRGTAKRFGFPKATFERNVQKLIDCGFVTLKESAERSQYAPNVFCFSDDWMWKDGLLED